ncbi:MAG: bifunctional folylpolyglutamate synthase/dihydrofolate synthase [Deltaproteobacteria bacterium]|nr:bifunctional folylpolyglutamate synthase/dihydrofolate synthase [Deltaproteobacteria bacterium]
MPSSKDILSYLYGLQKHGIKPGLKRIKELLEALGDPQARFPSIHIAGTNGKGSTSAMLASVLKSAGLKVGLYTSPHLVRFNERIRISGKEISNKDISRLASVVKEAAAKTSSADKITFFEFTTAMAFLYFMDKKVDMAILETGMGGRLDATNTVAPLVSIITNIGMDHTDYLGDTIEKIAYEKAGIIKKNTPVITAAENTDALDVIKNIADKKNAPLYVFKKDFKVSPHKDRFNYKGLSADLRELKTNLAGRHQFKNASCALAALEILRDKGFNISDKAIKQGLNEVEWPGRIEIINKKPLLILDSAHNPEGAATLRQALKEFKYKKLTLVLGIMADKDIDGIIKRLAPLADWVIITRPKTDRAASLELLSERLKNYPCEVTAEKNLKKACRMALLEAGRLDAVCVTGSIFTVGEAKQCLPKILKTI